MKTQKWPRCEDPDCRHSRIRHAPGDGTCSVDCCRCTAFQDRPIGRKLIEVLADDQP